MTREDIITLMCREYSPNFDNCVHDIPCPFDAISPEQQAEIYHKMMFLYDNVIVKHMRIKNET